MMKHCPKCKLEWASKEEFLADPEIKLIGYQPNSDNLSLGLFLFTHTKNSCFTTLSIRAIEFQDLLTTPLPLDRFFPGQDGCPGYCLHKENLKVCPIVTCPGSKIRQLINIIERKISKLHNKAHTP